MPITSLVQSPFKAVSLSQSHYMYTVHWTWRCTNSIAMHCVIVSINMNHSLQWNVSSHQFPPLCANQSCYINHYLPVQGSAPWCQYLIKKFSINHYSAVCQYLNQSYQFTDLHQLTLCCKVCICRKKNPL